MMTIYDTYEIAKNLTTAEYRVDVERTAAQYGRELLPILRNHGVELQCSKVLEIGAGWGRNLLALQQLGAQDITGVDISKRQVSIAEKLGLRTVFVIEPGEDLLLRFAQRAFDVVLLVDVLEHLSLEELQRTAQTLTSLLAPNGLVVIQVPNDLAPFNPLRSGDLTHLRCFTFSSLRQFFALANMEPIEIWGAPLPGFGFKRRLRRALMVAVMAPLIRLMFFVLYGRTSDMMTVEPNILAVGRRRSTE